MNFILDLERFCENLGHGAKAEKSKKKHKGFSLICIGSVVDGHYYGGKR
ncbi:hypothetical protein [Lactobacillus delbrueckii]|uniref:Uncharacterized protein n=1 Tax=Lactobacillus delbrueckii subsp. lactis TaxID=29397 RepID=A0ABD4SG23_LACDL|nr:hypothetical protein [Lactobacillus delbrueckii]MCD5561822.1 hypothetical protein [Lactobacillus delbrueckii subsp. lactis]MCD5562861.1 hypothetical protein [Lactobacillus delbrueckii subsp. lactis]